MRLLWKELELGDRELIESYYEKEPVRNCEFTFGNNYLWKPYYPIFWSIVEGSLVFESGEGGMSVSFPQGAVNLRKTVDELSAWFARVGRPFQMHLVSPEQFQRLEALYPGRFRIDYDRDNADYVYEREKLLHLSGKELHGKKNHCNKFQKEYPDWSYEPITSENVEECLEMAREWWAYNDHREGGEKEEEIAVTIHGLREMQALHLTGGLLRAGGRVVAFALGEPCGKDMFVVHFEKALADVDGAYSMINQQFVEHAMEGYTYVNREDDAGAEGLRQAKLSYHPAFLMEKGLVTEIRPGSYAEEMREKSDPLELTREMLHFIDESPTAFHAAANVEKLLREVGFERMEQIGEEGLVPGRSYYTMQNGSSVVAVRLPKGKASGFRIVASHSDSPCFKIKEQPEIRLENRYVKLNTETYGGTILSTWFDRPLGVAGRVVFRDPDSGKIVQKLVDFRKDMLVIPSLAVHFNRKVNDGQALNPQEDLPPLFCQNQELTLRELCAGNLGIPQEEILGSDLYVYNRDKGRILGADNAFIGAPRLDDLQCVFSTLKGFLDGTPDSYVTVYALFDNEEVGSSTRQGADSTLLSEALDIVMEELGIDRAREKREFLQNSFLLSADNGHAVHPNYPGKSDAGCRPYLNGGVVLKFQGSQRYATDACSAALVRSICRQHGIALQDFANRSDIAGGSTLGNISTAHVSISTADIGLAQLAMHSAFETGGVKDTAAMADLVRYFMEGREGFC